MSPIRHKMRDREYFRVNTREGVDQWLAIPKGTPVEFVTTPAPPPRPTAAVA